MTDAFRNFADTPAAPATHAAAIVPSDVAALPFIPKAIYVGVGGDIAMRGAGDSGDSLWRNVPDGALLPFRASHVRATGTSAGALLALG